MEKVYRKVGKKYISCGYNNVPDLSDGIWIINSKSNSTSMSNVAWRVGNIDRPCDITTHAALQSLEEDLSSYLLKLGDVNSQKFIQAKEDSGGWLKHPVQYGNISASHLCTLFLKRISLHLEDGERLHWDKLQYKFREETQFHTKPEFHEGVKVLYKFTEWLKANNIKFRQGKNIG